MIIGNFFNSFKVNFEINPDHPVMKELLDRIKSTGGEPDEETKSPMSLIVEVAMINSGFTLEDPTILDDKIQKLIKLDMGINIDAKVEPIEVELDDELDEEELEADLDKEFDADEVEFTDEEPEEDPEEPEKDQEEL